MLKLVYQIFDVQISLYIDTYLFTLWVEKSFKMYFFTNLVFHITHECNKEIFSEIFSEISGISGDLQEDFLNYELA